MNSWPRSGQYVSVIFFCSLLVLLEANSHNPCCSFPCQHDSICMTKGFEEYECDCTRTGYYGNNCEIPHWSTWIVNQFRPDTVTLNDWLTRYEWIWNIVNNIQFLREAFLRFVFMHRADKIPVPPTYVADGHEYATLQAYFNHSYYAMLLPPIPKNCPTQMGVSGKKELPDPQDIAERLFKRKTFIPDPMNTSALFAIFAQHFTHQFFKTEYPKGPGYFSGQHGIDLSNTYGQAETENMLREYKDGKLKSQIINEEEYPPYHKDVNVTMYYPLGVPEHLKFALGHPFFAILPGLLMMNTIVIREHNRVCNILKEEHPEWDDEQLFQTAKNIIAGETIKIAVEYYVAHLASYNFKLFYKPDILFDMAFQYDNRIYIEFNHLYRWHPLMPEAFNIAGTHYTLKDFLFNSEPVLKHGISAFVDAMSKTLGGKVSHHNHGPETFKIVMDTIADGRKLRLQPFNNYRKKFNLKPYSSFEELTGDDAELAAILKDIYGHVDAVEFFVGLFMEQSRHNSPFGGSLVDIGGCFYVRGLMSHPISSPQYWKPSTFGGDVGFNIVKNANPVDFFCKNINGKCPLVSFRVPKDISHKQHEMLTNNRMHDEM